MSRVNVNVNVNLPEQFFNDEMVEVFFVGYQLGSSFRVRYRTFDYSDAYKMVDYLKSDHPDVMLYRTTLLTSKLVCNYE